MGKEVLMLVTPPIDIFSNFQRALSWRGRTERRREAGCDAKSFSVHRGDFLSPHPRHQCPIKHLFLLFLSTPLWCSKTEMKETPARCCRCCSSPWRRCSRRFRGGRRLLLRCRWCRWEGWVWSWRRPAAGASSCLSYAPWPGGSGTRSSPGAEGNEFLFLLWIKGLLANIS